MKKNNPAYFGGLGPATHFGLLLTLSLILAGCVTSSESAPPQPATPYLAEFPTPIAQFTPIPTRAPYTPGQLVDYIAQTGDTLPALAAHFNTSIAEIRLANPIIPQDASTMPPGFPMKIPIYYEALWGTPYQILPDQLYINGPAQVRFDTAAFINQHEGWLKTYLEPGIDGNRTAASTVDLVAGNFSISPRLLLALLEYQAQGLSEPAIPDTIYYLGYKNANYKGLYLQLVWAANTLNNGYYTWRSGALDEFETPDGRIQRPDPWQNAASVALHYYYSRQYNTPRYDQAIGAGGLAQAYTTLFGDPWKTSAAHLPGSLQQPALQLPFDTHSDWNYTGGPHTGWGKGEPFAAIDFAPTGVSECNATNEWIVAMADGLITRSDSAIIVLDLDGDGREQTGWIIFYLHVATLGRVQAGRQVLAGEKIGHPSCEGGESSGTHIHIARKYNGEWVLADGPLAFNMGGWVVQSGSKAYEGTLTRFSRTIIASTQSEATSLIEAEK